MNQILHTCVAEGKKAASKQSKPENGNSYKLPARRRRKLRADLQVPARPDGNKECFVN